MTDDDPTKPLPDLPPLPESAAAAPPTAATEQLSRAIAASEVPPAGVPTMDSRRTPSWGPLVVVLAAIAAIVVLAVALFPLLAGGPASVTPTPTATASPPPTPTPTDDTGDTVEEPTSPPVQPPAPEPSAEPTEEPAPEPEPTETAEPTPEPTP